MDSTDLQFVGAPCGSHGPYTFYKAVRFHWNNKTHILALGDFFFLKILDNFPLCIGEIQLLWDEKNSENQLLASVKLYFKPKDSQVLVGPDKTEEPLDGFGIDELVVMSEKLILTVEDLVARLLPSSVEKEWAYGTPIADPHHDVPVTEGYVPEVGNSELSQAFGNANGLPPMNFDEIEKEKKQCAVLGKNELTAPFVIMSYPVYCRYRGMMRRLEGSSDAYFNSILVMAIGGFTTLKSGMRVMFSRMEFEFTDLEDLEIHREDLAPNLKGRPRKRKLKRDDSDSNGYGSDQSSSASSTAPKVKSQRLQERLDSRNGIHGENLTTIRSTTNKEEERMFLKKLYKFMASKDNPIDRLPVLGCKQIDLYAFYMAAKKLGGYKKICDNRLWKNLYDQLGGQTTNTSAATSTRRHYEKLILPYENFLRARERAERAAGRAQAAGRDPHINGQIKDKPSVEEKEQEVAEEKNLETAKVVSIVGSETNSVHTDPNSVDTQAQEKVDGVKSDEGDEEKKASSFTSTGTGPEPPAKAASPSKPFKMEDGAHKKPPTFSHHVSPLEVPVYRHRDSTSILSPMMQRKHGHPHPYPYHYPMSHQSGSPKHSHNHNSHHKSPHHLSLSHLGDQQHHPRPHLNHHGHNSHHQKLPASVHKPPTFAHNKILPEVQALREQWQRFGMSAELLDPHFKDPHLLASQPGAEPLRDPPPPAHTRFVRYPTTAIPDLVLKEVHLRRLRVHTDVHTSLDMLSFPHPDQVLSRIHNQQAQLLMNAHQLPASSSSSSSRQRTKTSTTTTTAVSSARTSLSSSGAQRGPENYSSELFAGMPSFKDSSKRARPSPQPGPSSSGGSGTGSSTMSLSSLSGSHGGSKTNAAQQAAEAMQHAQQQQQEVLLQSALFGSQFTALPRPAKPADAVSAAAAVSAFLPSMHPHPAFVQALMSQGYPVTSAASALFAPQLSPSAMMAYSDELRQSMFAAASLSPFMQLGAFSQPSSKDSHSQQK